MAAASRTGFESARRGAPPDRAAPSRPRARPSRIGLVAALLCTLSLAPGTASAEETAPAAGERSGYAGRSLTSALLDLRARGLKIVFSSNVVRAEMKVSAEPTESEPRRILEELLAEHALEARDGPNDTVVVVPRVVAATAGGSSIHGFIGSRREGTPVVGAVIRVVETGIEVTSDEEGGFSILDPGSGTVTLEARSRGFVVEQLEPLSVGPGERATLTILLDPAPILEEELVVMPSRVSLLREQPAAPLALTRAEILALPHLGNDFFRALTLLPGATANDVSAEFHVRGGRRDETLILIDGQELYDAYHLKDFDNALSFVAPATLGTADLTTGGFRAQYGDRMAGVLDMTSVRPTGDARFRLGVGIANAQIGGAGTFHDERGSWLVELRRGSIDLIGQLLGDEDPEYWDAFAKVDRRFGDAQSLRANLIYSRDRLDFEELIEGETKAFDTDYESSHAWLTHQTIVGPDLFFETAASIARVDRDRRGTELEEDARFAILDRRDLEVFGLRQSWSVQWTKRQALDWGWQLREFDSEYDYFSDRSLDNPLARIRHDFGIDTRAFRGRFDADQDSVHVADRLRLAAPVTLELGLRYDRHSQTDESHLTPRLNLAVAVGERSVLRAAWGRFNQGQRPYELQVEDGETGFHPVERSEHRVVGFERLFGGGAGGAATVLRIELYQREVGNPRPRYENLFEPINTFPEVEPDRVRIAPEEALAQGVEVFVRGSWGRRLDWWANYAWASTEDRLEGRWTPRIFDATHNLNLDVDYRAGEHWRLNLAWRYHTGWPTTPLAFETVEDDEGEAELVPVLGPLNSQRLPSYHRLDLRASRGWRLRSVSLDLYVDIQNLYDRGNVAGFDTEVDEDEGTVVTRAEEWTGILPSAGIRIEF